MDNFEFSLPTQIYFGKGQEDRLGGILKEFSAKKVLLLYGGGSIKASGLHKKITERLTADGIDFVELGGVKPNPRLEQVYEGIKLCRKNGCDFILAVGGGSVIDSAKAISVGVNYGGDVWDIFMGAEIENEVLPVGAVLTIPAAGSETSTSMVITEGEGGLKRGKTSLKIRPRFAIMNPEFCFTLPKEQISNGISDILAHLLERYFTNTENVGLTDGLLESAMRTVIQYGQTVYNSQDDYDAWCQIMWAGSLAHCGILDTGRVGDWASHGIEHELSGLYDVAHGAGLAAVFPAWMRYVYKHDLKRFERFAKQVFSVTSNGEFAAVEGICKLTAFYKSLDLPVTAAQLGAREEDFAFMAQRAVGEGTRGNFVKLDKNDIEKIYRLMVQND